MPVYHGYTVAFRDEATGKRFWQHAETGKTTWQSPGDWEEIHSKNRPDQPRYIHRVTNVMTWKKPEYLAWIRVDYDNNENDERASSSESVVQNAVSAANARTAAASKASAARRRREDDADFNGKTASAESVVKTSVPTIILAAPSGEGTVRRREGAELKDFELSEARLSRYSLFHPHTNGASEGANAWYQNNVEPSITCPQEERIGIHGEGGKWMCNIDALKEKKDCLIYSVGSENDFTWEEEVKRRAPNCEIHTFDHTVANATNKPDDVFFHQWGLTENDSHRNPKLKSLSEMIKALKHENRRLDVFKIDCEGCEWQTHKTWFTSGVQIVEILVETHHGSESPKPDSNAKQFFAHLHNSGYRIFHKEPNVHHSGGVTLCVEFALRRI